jgi:hypothetical protein
MATFIHIRCAKTGRYLTREGDWTSLPDGARHFKSAREAADACRDQSVAEAELIITRENQPPLAIRVTFHK